MLSAGAKVASDSDQTRSMVTSLWMVAENVGSMGGTFLGGLAYDDLGFENGLMVIAGVQLLALAVIPLTCCGGDRQGKPKAHTVSDTSGSEHNQVQQDRSMA